LFVNCFLFELERLCYSQPGTAHLFNNSLTQAGVKTTIYAY
jgi:hypothetical protein